MKVVIWKSIVSRSKNRKTRYNLVITEEQLEDVMFAVASILTAFILVGSIYSLVEAIGNAV